jgi:HAD superfamily hydrolase (TIGR01509 family)
MMNPYQAIIFDMDGLLVDSEVLWSEAENGILLEKHGVVVEDHVRERLLGMRNDEFMAQLRQIYNIQTPLDILVREVLDRLLELIATRLQPMPGAHEIVRWVAEHGIPTAIASSSPLELIEAVVQAEGWETLIPVRCSAQFLPAGKPAPDVYLKAAESIGIAPQHCLALEDSPNGARAAVAAGMTCYAVPDLRHMRAEKFIGITNHIYPDLHAVRLHLIEQM